MGIITLLLLGAFTLIYASEWIPKKPPFVEKAISFLFDNMKYLGIGAFIYGLIDAIITPLQVPNVDYMVVRLLSDMLIVIMALPFCFDKLVAKHKEKMNEAVLQEFSGSISWVRNNAKIVGAAGIVMTILMFAFVFR